MLLHIKSFVPDKTKHFNACNPINLFHHRIGSASSSSGAPFFFLFFFCFDTKAHFECGNGGRLDAILICKKYTWKVLFFFLGEFHTYSNAYLMVDESYKMLWVIIFIYFIFVVCVIKTYFLCVFFSSLFEKELKENLFDMFLHFKTR